MQESRIDPRLPTGLHDPVQCKVYSVLFERVSLVDLPIPSLP